MKHEEATEAIQELIRKILPNGRLQSFSSSASGASQDVFSIGPEIKNANESLRGSLYDYPLSTQNEFIHFTTLKNAISIINETAIRFYDLNNSEDPNEFLYSSSVFKGRSLPEFKIKNLKSCFFSFSMMKHTNAVMNNEYQYWQLYGDRCRGIGLVFSINKANQYEWQNACLGKVLYGDSSLAPIQQFIDEYEKMERSNMFSIGDPYKMILPILCLHKNNIYQFEEEVRLFRYEHKSFYLPHSNPDIMVDVSKRLSPSYFIRQSIKNDTVGMENPDHPKAWQEANIDMRLSKIIIGPQYSYEEIERLHRIFGEACSRRLPYEVSIEPSELTRYFNSREHSEDNNIEQK